MAGRGIRDLGFSADRLSFAVKEARLLQTANDGHPAARAIIGGIISNLVGSLRNTEKNTDALFPR